MPRLLVDEEFAFGEDLILKRKLVTTKRPKNLEKMSLHLA